MVTGRQEDKMDAYKGLKTCVIEYLRDQVGEAEAIEKILPHCEGLIESKRNVAHIRMLKRLPDLFEVLELRDELSKDNVDILLKMSSWCGKIHVEELVRQYMKGENVNNCCTVCKFPKTNEDDVPTPAPAAKKVPSRVKSSISMEVNYESSDDEKIPVIDKAIMIVAPRIGRKWTDIARHLKLSEEEIDAIDVDNQRLSDKIHAMFKIWKEKNGERATLRRLHSGFARSHRNDLADMIYDSDEY